MSNTWRNASANRVDIASRLPRGFSLNSRSVRLRNHQRWVRRAIDRNGAATALSRAPSSERDDLTPRPPRPSLPFQPSLPSQPSQLSLPSGGPVLGLSASDALRLVAESRLAAGMHCPHCRSASVKRYGFFPDKSGTRRQRYRCKVCGQTCNQLTGTPLAGVRRLDLCLDMAVCIVDGLSVRKAAARLGVHFTTAFRWRHRILGAALRLPTPILAGIIEAMVMVLPYSEKGQRPLSPGLRRPRPDACAYRSRAGVLLALDRHQRTLSTYMGQSGFQMPVPTCPYHFPRTQLAAGSVLCAANGQAFLARECKKLGLQTAPHAGGELYTIRNVVDLQQRLRGWLQRFRGVATRHLDKYLTLHRYSDRLGESTPQAVALQLLAAACSAPNPVRSE